MKLKKILAGASAAVITASALAVSTSAGCLFVPDKESCDGGLLASNGSWLLQLYNTGEGEANKPARDYGIKPSDVASFVYYFELVEPDDGSATFEDFDMGMDGGFGGGVIYSANGGGLGGKKESDIFDEESGQTYFDKYNWITDVKVIGWWGLPSETDYPGIANEERTGTVTYDGNGTYLQYLPNPFSYKLEFKVPDDCRWPADEDRQGTCYQIGTQEWGNSPFFTIKVAMLALYDDNGELMLAFDEFGYQIENEEAKKRVTEYETKKEVADTPEETEASANAPEESGDTASTSDASANSSAPASAAPTTTAAQSSSNSGSNNTGLIIGIIAVVVVVVVVVVVIVIKKKKS